MLPFFKRKYIAIKTAAIIAATANATLSEIVVATGVPFCTMGITVVQAGGPVAGADVDADLSSGPPSRASEDPVAITVPDAPTF